MSLRKRIALHPFFIRLLHWEFWSFGMVYYWIMPVWLWLSIRARSFFFFSASNPTIEYGGFTNESKKDIYKIIPPQITPFTIFFDLPVSASHVKEELNRHGLYYPVVGKPNKGGKGRGVKVLKNETDLENYVSMAQVDFHIQEFISLEKEVGIFYYRFPGMANGKLTGIVEKEFMTVEGNGKDSIETLLMADKRSRLHIDAIRKMLGREIHLILGAGEKKVVVPYGNHARGAKFIDNSHLITERLTRTIDEVCQQIDGFYFGRLDIRYNSWEELEEGKNFSVIEVNGAGSEPTHIYDPRHSIFFAWKEIIRHWLILFRVSRLNHKQGHPYLTLKEGLRMFREDGENSRKLAQMPE